MLTIRVSRSVCTIALNQTDPNTGSFFPAGVTETADIPVKSLFSNVSTWG